MLESHHFYLVSVGRLIVSRDLLEDSATVGAGKKCFSFLLTQMSGNASQAATFRVILCLSIPLLPLYGLHKPVWAIVTGFTAPDRS